MIKERIYSDKDDPNTLHNDVTSIDNALTRPWSVRRSYRVLTPPIWVETQCSENNHHVVIGKENYVLSGDGYSDAGQKDQAPPDLRYFGSSAKGDRCCVSRAQRSTKRGEAERSGALQTRDRPQTPLQAPSLWRSRISGAPP